MLDIINALSDIPPVLISLRASLRSRSNEFFSRDRRFYKYIFTYSLLVAYNGLLKTIIAIEYCVPSPSCLDPYFLSEPLITTLAAC